MPVESWSDDIVVAQLGDEPAFSEDMLSLISDLGARTDCPDIVVNLANVAHLNSSNISQLLRVRQIVIDRDARLRLASPSDAVWALFDATGIRKVFNFAEDVPSALASLQMQPRD